MRIGGFQKLSLTDYPGKLSAIIWTIGCTFRCPFCYNSNLVIPEKIRELRRLPEEYVVSYLERRKRFLDAVVITGGEPTIHRDLPRFIERIRRLDYFVKLDTNGTNSSMLKKLIDEGLIDYVSMDIKTRLKYDEYDRAVGGVLTPRLFENVRQSIKILLNSDIDYEFRTTLAKELHKPDDVFKICEEIRGAKAYYLQNVRNFGELLGRRRFTSFGEDEIKEILVKAGEIVQNVKIRQ